MSISMLYPACFVCFLFFNISRPSVSETIKLVDCLSMLCLYQPVIPLQWHFKMFWDHTMRSHTEAFSGKLTTSSVLDTRTQIGCTCTGKSKLIITYYTVWRLWHGDADWDDFGVIVLSTSYTKDSIKQTLLNQLFHTVTVDK